MRYLITLILVLFLTNLRSQNETKIILTNGVVFKNDQITGNVKKHTFFSKILNNEREVYVWIPEDYNLKNKKYPLLIAHDGGAVFYSRGGFGSKNKSKAEIIKNGWNLDESISDLISSNKIKPIIMVGVSNTKNRGYEYVPTRNAINYAKALIDELIPELISQYRIK